jgi:hypothetical protein
LYYFGKEGGLFSKCALDDLEIMALIISGACHDFEHPGVSNQYLIDNKDPISLRFNGTVFKNKLNFRCFCP